MLTLPGFTLLYCCQYYMKFSVNFLWMPFRANNLQNLKCTQTHFNQYVCFCMNMMNGCKWTEPWNFLATQHTQHAYILAVKRQGILQFNNCKNFSRSEEYIPYKHIHTRLLRNIIACIKFSEYALNYSIHTVICGLDFFKCKFNCECWRVKSMSIKSGLLAKVLKITTTFFFWLFVATQGNGK